MEGGGKEEGGGRRRVEGGTGKHPVTDLVGALHGYHGNILRDCSGH